MNNKGQGGNLSDRLRRSALYALIPVFALGFTMGLAVGGKACTIPLVPSNHADVAGLVGLVAPEQNRDHLAEEFFRRVSGKTKNVRFLSISGRATAVKLGDANNVSRLADAEIKWLQLDPSSPYLEVRCKEDPEKCAKPGEVRNATERLGKLKTEGRLRRLTLRYYNEMPVFRLVIVDDIALVSYYPRDRSEDDYPVFVFEAGKDSLFGAYEKYFDSVWERARHIQ